MHCLHTLGCPSSPSGTSRRAAGRAYSCWPSPGVQLTLGHFQLQVWTAVLVLLLGTWRAVGDGRPWRGCRPGSGPGLGSSPGGGSALHASWEFARFVGFTHRSFAELAFFAFPPAHWAELAIPGFLRGIPGGAEAPYWYEQGTSGFEACFYIGTLPLLLAFLAPGGKSATAALRPGFSSPRSA